MEALISGLLEYSRAGRPALPNELVDPSALVREIAELLEPGAQVEWQVAELPRVRGPKVLLQQVFHNLMSNAVKHATTAALRVEIFAVREAGADADADAELGEGVWKFCVRDNGPGIEPCYQARIWEIFQTLQPRDDVESTGIGLSLVRKIVEQRGGVVGLDSVPGEGACFHFTWPEFEPEFGLCSRERGEDQA